MLFVRKVLYFSYFLSPAEFFIAGQHVGTRETQLPQMELAHLSEVAQHTRPQAAVLDTPMLHSRIIPRGKAPTISSLSVLTLGCSGCCCRTGSRAGGGSIDNFHITILSKTFTSRLLVMVGRENIRRILILFHVHV